MEKRKVRLEKKILKKKILNKFTSIMLLIIMLFTTSCSKKINKYSGSFLNTFDTVVEVVAYSESQSKFDEMLKFIESRFNYYHKEFDIYNSYKNINNIKTINDTASLKEVKVSKAIIDLLKYSKEMYIKTDKKTNIAMGSVFNLWHIERENAKKDEKNAKLPKMEDLLEAKKHTNLDDLIINEEKSTVFIKDKKLKLDVGSIAKGYATECIAKEIKDKGYDNLIISAGGNIKAIGKPMAEDRSKWGVGIQNPYSIDDPNAESKIETLFITTGSVVSSGDYERFYTYKGKRYSHIIDPKTLYPAETFRQVTIYTENSALADFLSTTLYILSYEEGLLLAKKMNVDVMWVFKDKSIKYTENLAKYMKSKGANNK